jgi:predicted dehydrogenase
MSRLRIVVVGYGYWGPNIVRNVLESQELELVAVCERDQSRADKCAQRHAGVATEPDLDALLARPDVDAVSVATPPRTHFDIARRALDHGKHVLVEKPLATSVADARALIALAEERGLVLMPGHTFLYSPPVNAVRRLIESGELGEIYFVTSSRMNLGLYQADGVVRDLAPHDLSILLHWLDSPVTTVSASGRSIFQRQVPETAFLSLGFASGATANVQVSWLAPRKVRQMVVVGSKRMVIYDDTATDDIVRVYDRGLDWEDISPASFGEYRLSYRSGDMVAPRIDAAEPLALELQDFVGAIREGRRPRSHAALGLEVVEVLEAAQASLDVDGDPVRIGPGGLLLRRAPHDPVTVGPASRFGRS